MTSPSPITVIETLSSESLIGIRAATSFLGRPLALWGGFQVFVFGGWNTVVFTRVSRAVKTGGQNIFGVKLPDTRLSEAEAEALTTPSKRTGLTEALRGECLYPIDVATAEFERRRGDIRGYRVELLRDGDQLLVSFTDAKVRPGSRLTATLPGFEIALGADHCSVTRANFVR